MTSCILPTLPACSVPCVSTCPVALALLSPQYTTRRPLPGHKPCSIAQRQHEQGPTTIAGSDMGCVGGWPPIRGCTPNTGDAERKCAARPCPPHSRFRPCPCRLPVTDTPICTEAGQTRATQPCPAQPRTPYPHYHQPSCYPHLYLGKSLILWTRTTTSVPGIRLS